MESLFDESIFFEGAMFVGHEEIAVSNNADEYLVHRLKKRAIKIYDACTALPLSLNPKNKCPGLNIFSMDINFKSANRNRKFNPIYVVKLAGWQTNRATAIIYLKEPSLQDVIYKPNGLLTSYEQAIMLKYYSTIVAPKITETLYNKWFDIRPGPSETVAISNEVFEVIFEKNMSKTDKSIFRHNERILISCPAFHFAVDSVMVSIERQGGSLIFCSELQLFLFDLQLFISNFVKFMYCYEQCSIAFTPTAYEEFLALDVFLFLALAFTKAKKNLRIMSNTTHGPLIKLMGDHPQRELRRCHPDTMFVNEGSRAALSMEQSADMGTLSNYVEIVASIKRDE